MGYIYHDETVVRSTINATNLDFQQITPDINPSSQLKCGGSHHHAHGKSLCLIPISLSTLTELQGWNCGIELMSTGFQGSTKAIPFPALIHNYTKPNQVYVKNFRNSISTCFAFTGPHGTSQEQNPLADWNLMHRQSMRLTIQTHKCAPIRPRLKPKQTRSQQAS